MNIMSIGPRLFCSDFAVAPVVFIKTLRAMAALGQLLVDDLKIECVSKLASTRASWIGEFLAAFAALKTWLAQQTIALPLLVEFSTVIYDGAVDLLGAVVAVDVQVLQPVSFAKRYQLIDAGLREAKQMEGELFALSVHRPEEVCDMTVSEALRQERIAMAAGELLGLVNKKKLNLPFLHHFTQSLDAIHDRIVKIQCDSSTLELDHSPRDLSDA